MDKAAKELIEKLASKRHGPTMGSMKGLGEAWDSLKSHATAAGAGTAVGAAGGAAVGYHFGKKKKNEDEDEDEEKTSSMKNIIDDLIKGAQHNTFGRPVSIQQGFDPSPIDLAKFAGQLQALGEQGYSVKQAAEYLGLTERQVQDIVATVR